MSSFELESANLFVPGRASYITSDPAGFGEGFKLNLTLASEIRANVAAREFDPDFHATVACAGGYPGIAENWPPEHTPPLDNREAHLLAKPVEDRLRAQGWIEEEIAERVLKQGHCNNSIGDVMMSVRGGQLNPDDFHSETTKHGIEVVAGPRHFARLGPVIVKALNIDPTLVRRTNMGEDPYGTPATEFRDRQSKGVAIAKERVALHITNRVLRDVRPGNLDDLAEAEERFNTIVQEPLRIISLYLAKA